MINPKRRVEKKWIIIGIVEGYTALKVWRWDRYEIATFDTKKMAVDYIKKSTLKNGKFSKRSLLYGCSRAVTEQKTISSIIHNPK